MQIRKTTDFCFDSFNFLHCSIVFRGHKHSGGMVLCRDMCNALLGSDIHYWCKKTWLLHTTFKKKILVMHRSGKHREKSDHRKTTDSNGLFTPESPKQGQFLCYFVYIWSIWLVLVSNCNNASALKNLIWHSCVFLSSPMRAASV